MRINNQDQTIKRNYLQVYRFYIEEYEQVKEGEHPRYRYVRDFYEAKGIQRQTFLKYYNRYLLSGRDEASLFPQKRGPRWKTRRTPAEIEQLVLEHRENGTNRYEIYNLLKSKLKEKTPSPSTIYQILKRHNVNRLSPKMKEEKRKIIKEKAGELGHIDCYHIARDTIQGDRKSRYLVCVLDDCTRIAWAELIEDIKALTVMFATMRCLNHLHERWQIKFAEILSDNGPEFGPRGSKQKEGHPFERLLMEMEIKHRYTRPYRPQTNGKVERFWRTLNEDLIEGTTFESVQQFENELGQYLMYYNMMRPHQGIGGQTPKEMNQSCQRIT